MKSNGNLALLNTIFNKCNNNDDDMITFMKSAKLDNIIKICKEIEDGRNFSTPNYIESLLEWLKI